MDDRFHSFFLIFCLKQLPLLTVIAAMVVNFIQFLNKYPLMEAKK